MAFNNWIETHHISIWEKKHYLNLNSDWKLTLMQNLLYQQTSNSLPPVSGVVTMTIMFLSPSPETHQNCQGQNMNAATSWLHLEKKNYQNTICQTNYTSQTTAPTHFSSFLARRPCRLVSSLLRKVNGSQWESMGVRWAQLTNLPDKGFVEGVRVGDGEGTG